MSKVEMKIQSKFFYRETLNPILSFKSFLEQFTFCFLFSAQKSLNNLVDACTTVKQTFIQEHNILQEFIFYKWNFFLYSPTIHPGHCTEILILRYLIFDILLQWHPFKTVMIVPQNFIGSNNRSRYPWFYGDNHYRCLKVW